VHDFGCNRFDQESMIPASAHDANPLVPEICWRCGDYAALREHWGRRWCSSCMDRRDAIELDPPTSANLIKHSVALSLRMLWPALGLSILFSIPGLLLHYNKPISFLGTLTLAVPARAALQRLAFLRIVGTKPPAPWSVLRHVVKRYPTVVGTYSLVGLEVLAFSLMLVIPGIVRGFSYAVAIPVAINERVEPKLALEISSRLMTGHRLAALGAYALLDIPLIVSAYAEGIAAAARAQQHQASSASPGLHLVVQLALVAVLGLPSSLLSAVLHLKLSRAREQVSVSPVQLAGVQTPTP
jgi:hypothetical protein